MMVAMPSSKFRDVDVEASSCLGTCQIARLARVKTRLARGIRWRTGWWAWELCSYLIDSAATMSMLYVASRRCIASGTTLIRRGVFFEKLMPLQTMSNNNMATLALPPPLPPMASSSFAFLDNLLSWSTWFIKRTYQPSIIRKRRKHGFLERNKTVGGRKVLNRRKHKGRARLGGC